MNQETQLQENKNEMCCSEPCTKKTPSKRDIFRFKGETQTALNLDHVTHITTEGKRITFNFYSTSIFIELENEEAAASVFDVILNYWSAGM